MLRIPVKSRLAQQLRLKSTSSGSIRSAFIEYFEGQGHKHVRSSPVVPLCDSTVPFVNAGMNQFKGVFLGSVDPPCPRAVNSQKCVRVGGKHNDLDVVGLDGHHHTFFEMLGNWSFGDYYKKEACQMAWDLLLGPYRLKPENLVVTYFAGDAVIGLPEDRECRDIWKAIGVPDSRLKALGARDNFWEMGASGPCGPCTEIHHVNADGSLTEIWNLVFIQCNREADGSVSALRRQHVDTGLGLERAAALLQRVPTNYDTDLFRPVMRAIEENSKGVSPYSHKFGSGSAAALDGAYRRLADHARMVSVCLADGVFPASSLNLKQIMRKSFKISTDVFQNPNLLSALYTQVADSLGGAYPELHARRKDALLVIEHERQAYEKMQADLAKKWRELVKRYPEVEEMGDVETAGFALGYKEFKETMAKQNSSVIPGELVFKLYDTHGFQSELIERIAALNNLEIDTQRFWKLLSDHKARHKTAFKEQTDNKALLFDTAIENIVKTGVKSTNDQHKYNYKAIDNEIRFEPLKSKLVAILNKDCDWIDFLEPCEDRPYYLVAEDTNFYCEEGGQIADSGTITFNDKVTFNVDSVFKIRDFVFHKGFFKVEASNSYVNNRSDVVLEIDAIKRLNVMRNHTGVHLLNAALRKVLPNSVVCPTGSSVTDEGLSLTLSVYGDKLSQKVVLDAQELIRESIKCDVGVSTRVVDSIEVSREQDVVTIPGETYPETGLRLVSAPPPLTSKELCCGTHVPSTGFLRDVCVMTVKSAGGHSPTIHALTGERATQARELFCRAQKLEQVIELMDPQRRAEEVAAIREQLRALSAAPGAPHAALAACLAALRRLGARPARGDGGEVALQAVVESEVQEAFAEARSRGRRFVVSFLRCSYLLQPPGLARALARAAPRAPPALLLGCAGGVVVATCRVPQEMVTSQFTAERWLRCVSGVFRAEVTAPADPSLYAEMTGAQVSLINCEQLVQDAMRVAIKYAQAQLAGDAHDHPTQNRQQN